MIKKIIPIFVPHSGCPHDCIFCNQKKITGVSTNITKDTVRNIIKECLQTLDSKKHEIEIAFFGGSFTAIDFETQRELLSVACEYVNKGIVKDIRLSTRPDAIDKERLDLLKEYKVTIIELGVQSMVKDVLDASLRGHNVKDVLDASKLIRTYDFKLGLQMMVGLPNDTKEKSIYTCKEFININPDFVRIYPTLVVKNTGLEDEYIKKSYEPFNLENTIDVCKTLFVLFKLNDINIIRLGLQPSENISLDRDVVAGPYHAALGELVENRVFREFLDIIIKKYNIKDLLMIESNKKNMSKIIGNKKSNKEYFNKKNIVLKVIEANLDINQINIIIEEKKYEFSEKDILKTIKEELHL